MRLVRSSDNPATFTDDIFRPHADVIEDASDFDIVLPGWRDLLVHLAAGWAEILHADGTRIRLNGVAVHAGGMLISWESGDDPAPSPKVAHEIQRLRAETQDRSLQTCDLCGKPGVLRFWPEEVFAVRCDLHFGTGRLRGWREPAGSADLVANLLISHRGWLVQAEDAFVEVPWGWMPSLVEAFSRFRRMPTGRGFLLRSMRAVRGRLEICMEHDAADLEVDEVLDWQVAVRGLGDAALFTCDVCGDDGCSRRMDEGISAPRCDDHADYSRWPSHQWWGTAPEEQTRPMITSARPPMPARSDYDISDLPPAPSVEHEADAAGSPRLALYAPDDVRAALGLANFSNDDGHEQDRPSDSEQQARLRRILGRGEAGKWRRLVRPEIDMVEALDALGSRAPHLGELTSFLRRHVLATISIGLPVSFPPILILGEPGVGKSWFISQFASILGIPFVSHPMSGTSHSDAFGGAYPGWRNAQPGIVARTLLSGAVGNPVILVDEFDKVPPLRGVDDPFLPFFELLEPAGSRRFVDAFLQFPMDASRVIWILAANGTEPIPEPILSRLTIIRVPAPSPAQAAAIAASIYAASNGARRDFFDPELSSDVIGRLTQLSPRSMRIAIEHAMTMAASEQRHGLRAGDLPETTPPASPRMGFL